MADKFEGLLYIPVSDLNFISGIQRLKDAQLTAMLERLNELNETEGGHKGRIAAVKKELKNRGANTEIAAVEKMAADIQTAEELYSDGLPYEIERIENEIRFYQEQAGQSLLEMGKRLIRIKAHEEHGTFMKALENVGMSYRPAAYAMAAARKFSNVNSISHLSSTKMIALSVLDEEDVQTLDAGGEIAGMTLDDIDRMSTRELRGNLRKEKEQAKKEKEARKKDRASFEQSMLQKDAKINELDMRLSGQEPPTKEQIAQTALTGMTPEYSIAIAKVNGAIREAYALVVKAEKIGGVNVQQLSEWLGQFSPDMQTFHDLVQTWTDEADNAAPIADGRISDLPGGEE
jgi:hypothetical protein